MFHSALYVCTDSTLDYIIPGRDSEPHIWKGARPTGAVYHVYVYGGSLFATTQRQGIFRMDSGRRCVQLHTGVTDTIYGLAFERNKIFAATEHGLCISTDNGDSWKHDASGFSNIPFWCVAARGDTVIVGTRTFGIYVSIDGGASWRENNTGFEATNAYGVYIHDHYAFAATDVGIFRADLSGLSGVASSPETIPISLSISPNPARDFLRVRVEGQPNPVIRIFNMMGEEVLRAIGNDVRIDIRALPAGMYELFSGMLPQRVSQVTIVK
jgi:hypothetical protein